VHHRRGVVFEDGPPGADHLCPGRPLLFLAARLDPDRVLKDPDARNVGADARGDIESRPHRGNLAPVQSGHVRRPVAVVDEFDGACQRLYHPRRPSRLTRNKVQGLPARIVSPRRWISQEPIAEMVEPLGTSAPGSIDRPSTTIASPVEVTRAASARAERQDDHGHYGRIATGAPAHRSREPRRGRVTQPPRRARRLPTAPERAARFPSGPERTVAASRRPRPGTVRTQRMPFEACACAVVQRAFQVSGESFRIEGLLLIIPPRLEGRSAPTLS